MKFRRIEAVFMKQIKDTLKNKTALIQFVLFPLLAFILTETIAKSDEFLPDNYFVLLFAIMYVGMVPAINTASIITEEKEKNTLRILMLANVKPLEYLIGVGSYVFIVSSIGAVAFGFIGGYSGAQLGLFIIVLMVGILGSLILGSTIGIFAKNSMSSAGLVLPVSMITAFLPMIASFNETFESVSRFLYTQQINYLIADLSVANFTFERFIIIFVNVAILTLLFSFAYKKKSLVE